MSGRKVGQGRATRNEEREESGRWKFTIARRWRSRELKAVGNRLGTGNYRGISHVELVLSLNPAITEVSLGTFLGTEITASVEQRQG